MKLRVLVILSIITLIFLIAIQSYLVYNSYELKEKTITIDAKNTVSKAYSTKYVDSLAWLYRLDFLENLDRYKNNQISQDSLLSSLEKKTTEINPQFNRYFESSTKKALKGLKIDFKKVLTSITLIDTIGNVETLYPNSNKDNILILGKSFESNKEQLINNGTWRKEHLIDINGKTEPFLLTFKSSIYLNVDNWKNVILKEITGLLIISSLLLLFVVGLLYYSIQNLLKQKKVSKIKTDFINNITHELKTPLSTLSIATKTLASKYAQENPEIALDSIEVVERQNKRLQKIINQVLVSSLGKYEMHLNKETLDVSIFLNQLLDDFELTLEEGIVLNRDIENTGIQANVDPFLLGTAIINLLNNAKKYNGNRINVSYHINTNINSHVIEVSDNGIGIAKKYQKYIFEKFYRVGEGNTHNYKGLGLGLYYTSKIIEGHSGKITVSSKPKVGSDFIINIPI